MKQALFLMILFCLVVIAPLVYAQETKPSLIESGQAEREAMYYRYLEFASYVKGGSITPHWMADGSSFWYAEGAPANTVIWKVDPKADTKTPLFDAARLRKALTPLLGHEPPHHGLPFDDFTFVDREKAVKFSVENKEFILQLGTYKITRAPALSAEEKNRLVPQAGEVPSPDGRWFVGVKDYNLWLRSTDDGRSVQLTSDGVKDYEWDVVKWSPDGFKLAVKKVDSRKMSKSPIIHWLKPTEEVEWVKSGKASGPMPQTELFVVDILSKRQVRIDTGEEPDQDVHILGWRPDGSELLFLRMNREAKKLDLMAGNPTTGSTRVILTETQKTFIMGIEPFRWRTFFTPLEVGNKFIWMSERDGWNHLYLYDMEGKLIQRLTQGAFPVVRVVAIDESGGWVYFTGNADRARPYDIHLCRVNFDGKAFTRLTDAADQHNIQFAPAKEFFLDTHSSVDRPPAVEVRRADGRLLQTLSRANIDALQQLRWRPPEEFVVKAADGETDLYGVLYKPYDFDPNKKYPVIDVIYAGPQFSEVPHTFTHPHGLDYHAEHGQALAQLGFIAFVVDARGTPERGKEFQDVVYGNVGRYEIPDHVAALKQLAEKRSYMDLRRVGIFGKSFGGYSSIRAMLLAPDVYHVGIAIAGAADMDLLGVEPYMGLAQNNRDGYEYASNIRLVDNLKGKLLLIHGTSDVNDKFSQIVRMIDAFTKAGKPYDLIVLPEETHYFTETGRGYCLEAIRRYFQEHLKP